MSDQGSIPTLTDLIEKGIEIKMSDLGLEDDDLELGTGVNDDGDFDITEPDYDEMPHFDTTQDLTPVDAAEPVGAFSDDPALEQTIRRILDEHLELAFAEIRRAIQHSRRKP